MELTKEQAKALASVLLDEINETIRNRNEATIKEVGDSKIFNDAYNEFLANKAEIKKLQNKAEKMKVSALRSLRCKLANAIYGEWDSRDTMVHVYAKQLGKIKNTFTKQDIIDRIMLATIDAKDLTTLKENVLKMI